MNRLRQVIVLGIGVTLLALMLVATTTWPQGKGDSKAGEALYKAQCAECHGPAGAGDGPKGQKLKEKPANWSAGGGELKTMKDDTIFKSIAEGGPAVGKSRGMPAFPKLSDAEIWNLVVYVKGFAKK